MKAFTDIEQSKKLAEILPLESADMHYVRRACDFMGNPVDDKWSVPKYGNPNSEHSNYIVQNFTSYEKIPCWSLAALLGLMPKLYEFENDPDDGGCQPNLCKGWDNNQWHIVYRSSIYITEWYDEPIDAAVEMVCWLKENNKL